MFDDDDFELPPPRLIIVEHPGVVQAAVLVLGLPPEPDDEACTAGAVFFCTAGCPLALPDDPSALGNPHFRIWSFAHIDDLRTQAERYNRSQ